MARVSAGDRVRRLLAIVPWIVARDGPSVDEVCEQFGLERRTLLSDLESLEQVGVYPYTPGDFVTVTIEGDRIWIHYADYFGRPLRLTPEEGLALVAAGRALLAVGDDDGDGPLARGLAKLARSLRIDTGATDVVIGPAPQPVLEVLRTAVADRRAVEIDYYAFGRDERTHRVVEPARVFVDGGQWYLSGNCRLAGGERLFRVDRIGAAALLDETFDAPAGGTSASVFQPDPDDPRVVLALSPAASWVLEQYPVVDVAPLDDGWTRVTMVVTARPWLERLLLRLGPDARVVEADEPLLDAAATAARRVLARYGLDGAAR